MHLLRRILFLTCWALACLAHGAEPGRVVRVGVYQNAPKLYQDNQGKPKGILIDMLHEIAAAEGWELRYVPCSWAACLAGLREGNIDLLPDVAWTEERARVLDFHRIPVLHSWSQVYRRKPVAITSMADVGGKRIAVLSGSIQQGYLAELAREFGVRPLLVPVATVSEGFELAERGNVDAVVASKFTGALQAPESGLVETSIMFLPARLFYAVAKGRNADLLAAVDRQIGAWQAEPASVYFEILERWHKRSVLAEIADWLWWAAGLLILGLAVALAQSAWLKRQVARKSGALQEAELRLATILDSVDGLIYIKDTDYRYAYANRALSNFLGLAGDDIVGRRDSELLPPAVADAIRRDDERTITEGRRIVVEETVPDRHGTQVTVLSTKIPLCREDGSVYGLCGISIDISERRAAEESNRVAATVFQSAEGMFVADPNHRILRANAAYCAMTGYTEPELAGAALPPFSVGQGGPDAAVAMWTAAERQGKWQGEIWVRRKTGEPYQARLTVTAVRGPHGQITQYVGTQGDITAQKLAQEEIAKLAYFDPLTGLPNRRLLLERLRHSVPLHERMGQVLGLLFLDLDNFKDINDLRGHETGDRLLQQVGQRVSACTREGDTVARLGGDEFVILLENVGRNEEEAARHVATTGWKIIGAMREPFVIDGVTHHATCSLGATLRTERASDIDDLMKRGDMAMYAAKRDGRNTLRFFHPDMQSDATHRLALAIELREALRTSGFALHYQPQVDGDGRIVGAEALLRWESATRGRVGPAEFVPIAEASGLIVPLGRWALATACAQLARWSAIPAMRHLTVAVNVSARQLRHPDFVDEVLAIVGKARIARGRLKLELTETVLIDDLEDTIAKMLALKQAGVGFSLDDFGTGYSSLGYLQRLPLDELKIDHSFVRDILSNPNDASIARSIVALGASLGLGIIAEGVETEAQRAFLAGIGCRRCQGYLFGRAMEAAALEQLMAARIDAPH